MRPLEAQLETRWPCDRWRDVGVVVAVSGGPDSVALLRAMLALATETTHHIAVGHFNHQLRGEQSDTDERFVTELAERWNLPIDVERGDPLAEGAASGDGVEAAAREQRFRFLLSAAEKRGARFVVTAHTADDQVETVLHRILRGTGVAGLAGIPRARPLSAATTLIRPLLGLRRAEVLAYLGDLGQEYRVDASNAQLDFTRNRLRNDLLPKLEREYNSRVAEAILRLCQLAGEAQETIDRAVEEMAELVVTPSVASGAAITIDCRALQNQSRHLVRQLLVHLWRDQGWSEQSMGLAEWERLADLCLGIGGGSDGTFPGRIHARRHGHSLCLSRCI